MRPPGVPSRVHELIDVHQAELLADPLWQWRVRTDAFVRLSGRLGFGDVPVRSVLLAYSDVLDHADDPSQARTGTSFEAALGRCVDEVLAAIGHVDKVVADGLSPQEADRFQEPLTSIPPLAVLGSTEPDGYFHLVCITAARSAVEGVGSHYLAVRAIANMSVYRPAEDFGVVAIAERLAIRYEDESERRDDTVREIGIELDRYLQAVPFQV